MSVEQAIFASADTSRGPGYQLVVQSPGVTSDEAAQLTVWGPSHDSLLNDSVGVSSANFFLLESGAACVSRTTASGGEFSRRGGCNVLTHFLILSPDVWSHYANNAFAVLKAAAAEGWLTTKPPYPERLEPVELIGRASVVDRTAVDRVRRRIGPDRLASLVAAAISSERLAVVSSVSAELLFAAAVSLVPRECRPELSFTTGLRFATGRGFRWMVTPGDNRAERGRVERRREIDLFDTASVAATRRWRDHGWSVFVRESLAGSALSAQLAVERPGLTLTDLGSLGESVQGVAGAGSG